METDKLKKGRSKKKPDNGNSYTLLQRSDNQERDVQTHTTRNTDTDP